MSWETSATVAGRMIIIFPLCHASVKPARRLGRAYVAALTHNINVMAPLRCYFVARGSSDCTRAAPGALLLTLAHEIRRVKLELEGCRTPWLILTRFLTHATFW